ncbi:hypothetical protein GYMLUDRAFT_61951 [Collybiopsis luxurians FD-317 M1]|uniref:Uncharacterized protein n=1 Tax=Collybiopsis luxurians FD-317 M1 TaxID=944289 RepID=A0A0D0B0F4_9AGAR|nr:hypothetical protein GYMLUDRAFT_61951 [Collybiopsis luxurians FD-317 M1]
MGFPWETQPEPACPDQPSCLQAWLNAPCVSSILTVTADASFLSDIKAGYDQDDFVKKILSSGSQIPGVEQSNGLCRSERTYSHLHMTPVDILEQTNPMQIL